MAYKIIKVCGEIDDMLSYFAEAYQVPKTQQMLRALETGHHWFSSKQTGTPDDEQGHHGRKHFIRTCDRISEVRRTKTGKSVAMPDKGGNMLRTLQSMVWHETDIRYNQQTVLEACLTIWQATQSKMLLSKDAELDETENEAITSHISYRRTAAEFDAFICGVFELGMRYQHHVDYCRKGNIKPQTIDDDHAPWPLNMWPQGAPFPDPALDNAKPYYWSDMPAWVSKVIENMGDGIANRALFNVPNTKGPSDPVGRLDQPKHDVPTKPVVKSFL